MVVYLSWRFQIWRSTASFISRCTCYTDSGCAWNLWSARNCARESVGVHNYGVLLTVNCPVLLYTADAEGERLRGIFRVVAPKPRGPSTPTLPVLRRLWIHCGLVEETKNALVSPVERVAEWRGEGNEDWTERQEAGKWDVEGREGGREKGEDTTSTGREIVNTLPPL